LIVKSRYRFVLVALLCVPSIAQAAETITYSYDARGRLVKVVRTGTVNNNVQVVYTHDKANNRKSVVVTGSGNAPPP
jgi:YD repeat-containing protein